ncbi:MAG: 16S rRNA (guanine(966)-N(2))-methyltransferase RsmD [Alphaproteobacteria bacterium]|nr:16S rRNA (guanine(966)-N(2))-methyltransferase RsmD [Alphaproteobacteria bacterium]
MRIIGGSFKGTKLTLPRIKDSFIRPSSNRLRESIFNILLHKNDGKNLYKARVLDLFSGTGALGFEALSRGALYCLFVEKKSQAYDTIRKNIHTLKLSKQTAILRRDATRLGPATIEPFTLLFADPPYNQGLSQTALEAAAKGGWLVTGAICILEDHQDASISIPEGFKKMDQRIYRKTQILFLKWEGEKLK